LFQATKIDKEGFTSSPQHELEKIQLDETSGRNGCFKRSVEQHNLTLSFTII
jgi:hypothetical protein